MNLKRLNIIIDSTTKQYLLSGLNALLTGTTVSFSCKTGHMSSSDMSRETVTAAIIQFMENVFFLLMSFHDIPVTLTTSPTTHRVSICLRATAETDPDPDLLQGLRRTQRRILDRF